jgi:hypothetical protein
LLLFLWTTHQGGSLTHGTNYLTQYMPAPLKHWFVSPPKALTPGAFYTRHINPVLDANCVVCHGESKTSGGLRMDSYALMMKGGKDGAEIAWIRAWIQQGASPTQAKLAGVVIADDNQEILQSVGDYSGMMAEIKRLESGQGAKLLQVSSRPSDGLVLNTADVSSTFDDQQLAQFQKFAPFIVEAELARTAITDASFDTLSKFSHLRALHLEDTAVTGNGLAKLAPLSQLTYLNLSGTKVTEAALTPLDARKSFLHLYLYNTPAQPADAMQPIARKP